MSAPSLSTNANAKSGTSPFATDFRTMQQRFLSAAESAGAKLQAYPHPLPGPAGEALATDIALFGRRDAKKLMVLISGTHGVEGPFGSACQCEWMAQHNAWEPPEDTAVVVVHLINPWGAAWSRRVNEDNVDINRNFVDWNITTPANAGYAALHEALVCHDLDGPEREAADAALDKVRTESGDMAFSSIVSAGQYEFADGLFFGGAEPVWSNRTLCDILATYGSRAQQVIAFDLHTGAGPYGYPALLSVAASEHTGLDWGRTIFGPALTPVITGNNATTDTGIAATATGYVSEAVRQALPQARVLPLVIECGTLRDSETMQAMRSDNWLHLFGELDSDQGQQIKATLRDSFVPVDANWQSSCIGTSLLYFDQALDSLQSLGPLADADTHVHPDCAVSTGKGSNLEDNASHSHATDQSSSIETETCIEPSAVEVEDLHKSFGNNEVLKGIDLTARAGEVVSMIGSSGSGKSTLLRCINFLEQPNAGRIVIDGEVVEMKALRKGGSVPANQRQLERIRAGVGMVFQSFNLWPHMSVMENIIEAPMHVLKEPRKQAIEHAHALLEKVGLSEKHAFYPSQLSGGQQQRAAIARTLAMRPKVMLFDEPTSALDPELVGEVLRVIRQLAEEGNTMILVTHEMQFAREVSHKVLFLHQGKVEEQGSPDELFVRPRSERLRQFLARTF